MSSGMSSAGSMIEIDGSAQGDIPWSGLFQDVDRCSFKNSMMTLLKSSGNSHCTISVFHDIRKRSFSLMLTKQACPPFVVRNCEPSTLSASSLLRTTGMRISVFPAKTTTLLPFRPPNPLPPPLRPSKALVVSNVCITFN